MSWEITLPILPKGTNTLQRMHWTKLKKYKADLALLVLANAPSKKLIEGPVILHYTEFHAKRPKDRTNQAGALKAIEDAIVRLGVLEDDCPEIVTEIKYYQVKVPTLKEQKCTVRIETLTNTKP
jgi:Holliday junction resolvase RusA-like endonuclease